MVPAASAKGGPDRDELWTLYKIAIDDRNFQVTLNWDRTKHYFIFNFSAFAVGGAFSHLAAAYQIVQQGIFLLVVLNSFFAAYSIYRGHEYYREARTRLKGVERQLGLIGEDASASHLAINTTRGMKRETAGEMKARKFSDRITIVVLAIALQIYIGVAAAYALIRLL